MGRLNEFQNQTDKARVNFELSAMTVAEQRSEISGPLNVTSITNQSGVSAVQFEHDTSMNCSDSSMMSVGDKVTGDDPTYTIEGSRRVHILVGSADWPTMSQAQHAHNRNSRYIESHAPTMTFICRHCHPNDDILPEERDIHTVHNNHAFRADTQNNMYNDTLFGKYIEVTLAGNTRVEQRSRYLVWFGICATCQCVYYWTAQLLKVKPINCFTYLAYQIVKWQMIPTKGQRH